MSSGLRFGVILLSLLLGLMAGFFYAFSFTVMPGLDLLTGDAAMDAMRGINVAVRNPVFFATFALTPVLGFLLAGACLFTGRRLPGVLLLVSFAVYAAGVVALTASLNVPMNRALAEGSLSGMANWLEWSATWTGANHLRTAASLFALLLALLTLCRLSVERVGVAHRPG
ncbi:MAG: DUF1772 domain-containing protein [Minwuia sp.]|nr:DUF1772 domain-containing protein [Minwuia sp.]